MPHGTTPHRAKRTSPLLRDVALWHEGTEWQRSLTNALLFNARKDLEVVLWCAARMVAPTPLVMRHSRGQLMPHTRHVLGVTRIVSRRVLPLGGTKLDIGSSRRRMPWRGGPAVLLPEKRCGREHSVITAPAFEPSRTDVRFASRRRTATTRLPADGSGSRTVASPIP
jgi:hypothetical protein